MSVADGLIERVAKISLLRSLEYWVGRILYKHFVPTGLVVLVFSVLFLSLVRNSNVSASSLTELDPTPLLNKDYEHSQDQNINFSKFYHNNANHARLPCLLCHRREGTTAKPVLPGAGGHVPCTGCHAKEFANSSSPVCTICHTNTQSGALKPFPALKSFNVKFDHSIHARGQKVSCATCHRPSRGGVAMTIPAGLNAHTTCYQCHAPRAKANGRDISSCGTCHKPGGYSRTSTQAAAFKVGFNHAKHGAAQKLTCNECHNVRAGMPQRKQVTAPLALNHHAPGGTTSCASCHTANELLAAMIFRLAPNVIRVRSGTFNEPGKKRQEAR